MSTIGDVVCGREEDIRLHHRDGLKERRKQSTVCGPLSEPVTHRLHGVVRASKTRQISYIQISEQSRLSSTFPAPPLPPLHTSHILISSLFLSQFSCSFITQLARDWHTFFQKKTLEKILRFSPLFLSRVGRYNRKKTSADLNESRNRIQESDRDQQKEVFSLFFFSFFVAHEFSPQFPTHTSISVSLTSEKLWK